MVKLLGVAESVGPVMTFWVLPITFIPMPRSLVFFLQLHDLDLTVVKRILLNHTSSITAICDTTKCLIKKISLLTLMRNKPMPLGK